MKKIITCILCALMSLSLSACQKQDTAKPQISDDPNYPVPDHKDFNGSDLQDVGAGIFYLEQDENISEVDVPLQLVRKENDIMLHLHYQAQEFDTNYTTYFYIDGILNDEKNTTKSFGELLLLEHEINEGSHTVEVVQYENNDPDDFVVTYKKATYTITLE